MNEKKKNTIIAVIKDSIESSNEVFYRATLDVLDDIGGRLADYDDLGAIRKEYYDEICRKVISTLDNLKPGIDGLIEKLLEDLPTLGFDDYDEEYGIPAEVLYVACLYAYANPDDDDYETGVHIKEFEMIKEIHADQMTNEFMMLKLIEKNANELSEYIVPEENQRALFEKHDEEDSDDEDDDDDKMDFVPEKFSMIEEDIPF